MKPDDRDISTLRHIVEYCCEITEAISKRNLTLDAVANDSFNKNALSMSILQIGELVNVLSEDFRKAHSTVPWREIKRMRDKATHHYWTFDVKILWKTASEDIEPLKNYCNERIAEYECEVEKCNETPQN